MGQNIYCTDTCVLFIILFITGMDLSETITGDELISLKLTLHGLS